FKGEAIAIIAGDRGVLDTLDLSDFPVSWVPLSPTLNPAEALVDGARQLHPERPGNILVQGRVAQGNSKSGLAQATHVIEAEIETSFVEHAYIEPEAGSAWMDGDTLVIQACTQAPVMDQESVATILDLQKDKVRIIPTAAGGGFGSKLDISLQPFIGLVALKTGRPARMVYERSESMAATTKRHPALMRARIGIHSNGEISGMEFEGDFNTGPYASWGPTVANRVPVHASGPYRTPNYLATTRAILTNGPVAGAFRGFGVPQAAILQETIYDKLAETVGVDRLDFRIMNALRDGDRTVCGQELHGVGIVECLEALKPSWAASLAEAKKFNAETGHIRRGVGVASCWYGCGNTSLSNPSTVRIGVTHEGRVVLHQGATDIGQGANTVMTQIASDALGLPIESFDLIGPDTALTPDCGKTSASRQTVVTGKATLLAAQALRKDILRRANMGDNATLTLDAGRIVVADGTHRQQIVLQSLSPDARGYAISAEETYDPPTLPLDKNGQGSPYAVYGYGAQLAVVDVDTALGTVKVRRIIAAHDLGHVINPLLAEGQIEGGIAQGLGMALMEEFIPGRTENLHDYLIPTTGDMPTIETILIETPDPEGPLGAKGLGEHVLIPTAPAILNAIRHATGAEISKVPALPHRLLAAIKAKETVQ
ncbi:MAG: molybdopterin cofactor-binding domain-containing protein, partial [Opitutae bacterium]